MQAGKAADAAGLLRRTIQRAPQSADLHSMLSIVLKQSGQGEQAIYFAAKAAELAPRDAVLKTNLASMLMSEGKTTEALAEFDRAIVLGPNIATARAGRASCLHIDGRLADALDAAADAVRLDQAALQSRVLFARYLLEAGRADEAVQHIAYAAGMAQRALRAGDPSIPPRAAAVMFAELALTMLYASNVSEQDLAAAHATHAEVLLYSAGRWGPGIKPIPRPPVSTVGGPPGSRKLRIGYISGDFRRHSVASFISPLLNAHDRGAFEIFCYKTSAPKGDDDVTARLKSLGHTWREIAQLDDAALAATIKADGIDVLVELSGLTPGMRVAMLALRPAPVQLSFIGYPHTLGLAQIDARIADEITDPQATTMANSPPAADRVLRASPCFLCYDPPTSEAPEPRIGPGASGAQPGAAPARSGVVFASFNNISKITPPVIEAWSRILAATPGSSLVLKSFRLSDARVRAALASRFAAHSFDVSRINVLEKTAGQREHLDLYNSVDIALDTWPYNGTTTTCEALFMGRPVVTLAGTAHRSRVGASLLAAIGASDLVAASVDDYVALATKLAHEPARLATHHTTLRQRVLASPLCNAAAHARGIESLYRAEVDRVLTTPGP